MLSKFVLIVLFEGVFEYDYKIFVNVVVKNVFDVFVVLILLVKVRNEICLCKWMLNVYY